MTRRQVVRALLVVAVLAAGGAAWLWTRPNDLGRVRDELDAADPGWRFADVYAARLADQPPPAENVVLEATLAAALIPPEFVAWKVTADADPDLWPRLPTNRKPADVPAWRTAAPAVTAGRRLKDHTRGLAGVTVTADPFQTLVPHYDPCYRVAELLWADAILSAAHGDPAGATDSARAILSVARGVGRDPFALGYMYQANLRRIAAEAILWALAQAEVPADRLAAAHADLAAAADPGAWAAALRDWRAIADREFEAIADGEVDLAFATQFVVTAKRAAPNRLEQWRYRLHVGHDHAAVLRRFTALIDIARRPAHEWVAAEAAVPLPPDDDRHLFGRAEAVQARRLFADGVRHLAVMRAASLAIGCERFRQRHGRWPGSLAELPADLTPADTTDPFTGQPLRLKHLADGLVVYSVGPDGADDGGVFGTAPANPPRQDVGFRLWDVTARGQSDR